MCMHIYIYIYIYIEREDPKRDPNLENYELILSEGVPPWGAVAASCAGFGALVGLGFRV